ncbi:MAG: hydroxyethylthiazole kinase [Candidatus Latescibacteria bacterium]|nr:hydroxyethylthiazole kinase [Candidatus Latescibacterota bacterium]
MFYEILSRVRNERPLVHHITNWVTIYDCANITRMVGALPVMAHACEESAEMAGIASALVLNIGTLTPELVESMIVAGKSANRKNIPVILDVVGVGATKLRDVKALELLHSIKVDIIKGNASEIARLSGEDVFTRGVESTGIKADAADVCVKLAKQYSCTIVMTGREDIVSDGKNVYIVRNGDAMMGNIVGTGCMAASVIGSFAGVEKDYARAAVAALVCYEIAAELAVKYSRGPGSFKENLFDALFNLDKVQVNRMANVEEKKA